MTAEHLDVLIIGAGFSGIAAAYHMQRRCPDMTFAIVEARDTLGGTWDLFRYPGIRSDSDMFTFGFSFKPWTGDASIASGAQILDYLKETSREFGIDQHIHLQHRVVGASWSTAAGRWTVDVARPDGTIVPMTCGFLLTCTGYYDYNAGYMPSFEGSEQFSGQIVHPQFWPANLDYSGKRVVVIGSGATAVTVVPAMAEKAAHVTMLQRSPSYVAGRPSRDGVALRLRGLLPIGAAHRLTRWKNILTHLYYYSLARRKPETVRTALTQMASDAIGPNCDVQTHFSPRYDPWDQRLCFVPDNDLFVAIRDGRASVETDTIERFNERGIELTSGKQCDADIIVTATGLSLQLMAGIPLKVDGVAVDPAKSITYRGLMYSGIPNLASIFGYTNAPFTMRADPAMRLICRILRHLQAGSFNQVVPTPEPDIAPTTPFIDMASGYVERTRALFPDQGARDPWRIRQNYLTDRFSLDRARLSAGLSFSKKARP
ncbi:MAG: flavin-containing monooxygenase [Sphingomonadaceae bacterium]